MLDVTRIAVSSVIEDAQTVKAKGGKMRVDTGFLRASGLASLNTLPSGPSKGRKRTPTEIGVLPEYSIFGESLNLVLAKMKLGDTFYWGWTANYARYREIYDGFLDTALQKWQQFVDDAVKKVGGK